MSRWPSWLLLTGALLFPLQFLYIAWHRIAHPFAIEWFESAILLGVDRMLDGHPLYAAPSLEYLPIMYTPLFSYLGALVGSVAGASFGTLRALSVACTLVCFALVFWIARRESRSAFAGALAVCLFAATYRISGSWFDLARVDMLALALVLGAAALLRGRQTRIAWATCGALLALAYLAKQTTLGVAVALLVYAVLADTRKGLVAACVMVAGLAAAAFTLDWHYHGWFTTYVFVLPAQTWEMASERLVTFFTIDLFQAMPIAFLAAAVLLVRQVVDAAWRPAAGRAARLADAWFLPLLAGGMLGAAWIPRLQVSGAYNALIPAYAALCIASAVVLQKALAAAQTAPRGRGRWFEGGVLLLAAAQFALLLYDPFREIPSARDAAAGRKLVARLATVDGPVYVPYQPVLATMAGKRAFAHGGVVAWLLTTRDAGPRTRIYREFERAFRERRFAAVASDAEWVRLFPTFERHYVRREALFDAPDVFWTRTGHTTRPEALYTPGPDS